MEVTMIYFTGDTHRKVLNRLNNTAFPMQHNLTKKDYVIIMGDMGALWFGNKEDKYILDWLNNRSFTTLFVEGNHENYSLLYDYDTEIWNCGKIRKIRNSVIHLDRGQVFNINGIKFFTFGGADSIDKVFRVEHVSWWKEEMPNKKEMDIGLDNLEKHNWTVDYILTHDCAKSIFYELKKFKTMKYIHDPLKEYLEVIKNKVNYKHWYFGHYHINQQLNKKHTILYDYILPIQKEQINNGIDNYRR